VSLNDRCAEAADVLRHGGTIPDSVRTAMIEDLLACARGDGGRLGWGIARDILDANPDTHRWCVLCQGDDWCEHQHDGDPHEVLGGWWVDPADGAS